MWLCIVLLYTNFSPHLPHWNSFFWRWTVLECCQRLANVNEAKSHWSQMWSLCFFSWTTAMCSLRVPLWLNALSHLSQWNGFFFSWTEALWVFRVLFSPNALSHLSQLNGFFFSWTVAMWPFKCILPAECFCHICHNWTVSSAHVMRPFLFALRQCNVFHYCSKRNTSSFLIPTWN